MTDQGTGTALIDPGKPWQNGVSESFNGKFRDECLSLEWFQRGSLAFEHRLFDGSRVRREAQTDQRSSRFRNGPGRCGRWSLRTPARCNTVLEGTIQAAGDASSLKLTVVRRIRAGHSFWGEHTTLGNPRDLKERGGRRDEPLDETLFASLTHASVVIEDWPRDYNNLRDCARFQ
jgi:Integrase core domain